MPDAIRVGRVQQDRRPGARPRACDVVTDTDANARPAWSTSVAISSGSVKAPPRANTQWREITSLSGTVRAAATSDWASS